jgi:hypothetical protein
VTTVRPALGDWQIPNIDRIETLERRSLVEFPLPGETGSVYQDMASDPTRLVIAGSLYGDEARDGFLEEVRTRFTEGEPLTFVADIVAATELRYVVVETLRFEQVGTRPDETSFWMVLRESPPTPPPESPLAGLDAGLLEDAAGFIDTATGALGALDALAGIPDFGNPLPPLRSSLDEAAAVASGLGEARAAVEALLGLPG